MVKQDTTGKCKIKKKVGEIWTNYPKIHKKIISLFELNDTPIQLEHLSSSSEQEIIYQMESNSGHESSVNEYAIIKIMLSKWY